jgi:hypothetical protein
MMIAWPDCQHVVHAATHDHTQYIRFVHKAAEASAYVWFSVVCFGVGKLQQVVQPAGMTHFTQRGHAWQEHSPRQREQQVAETPVGAQARLQLVHKAAEVGAYVWIAGVCLGVGALQQVVQPADTANAAMMIAWHRC